MAGYDKLTPEGERFFAELEELMSKEVFIGYQVGESKHVDKETGEEIDMAEVAMFNELGTENSPPRPFLRMSVDNNQDRILRAAVASVKSIAKEDGTAEKALKQLGTFGKRLVQETIVKGTFEPNAPATIKKKKSSKPLINKAQMRQQVNYVIKQKGED